MSLLDDALRMQLAAMLAGMSVVDFQMRLLDAALSAPAQRRVPLRLVSDLHGIAVDPDFIKDA